MFAGSGTVKVPAQNGAGLPADKTKDGRHHAACSLRQVDYKSRRIFAQLKKCPYPLIVDTAGKRPVVWAERGRASKKNQHRSKGDADRVGVVFCHGRNPGFC